MKKITLHKIKLFILVFVFLSTSFACNKNTDQPDPDQKHNHLKYFGFTLVDTYWDDPTDTEIKVNYIDEIAAFSNSADILVIDPADLILPRINRIKDLDMGAIINVNELFFEVVGASSPSGNKYRVRSNFKSRWHSFVNKNNLLENQEGIQAFYIGEEPTWNGLSFQELKSVTDYVKNEFRDIPIMLIEAHPTVNDLEVPSSVDWIGFDHYFIKNPNTNPAFQEEWKLIKTKLSAAGQKLVVIMDSHYIDWAHGDFGNIELNEMQEVAKNYYTLAKSDTSVIALLGYFWPNGFDDPEAIGARGMPIGVQEEYIRIGKEITGKN